MTPFFSVRTRPDVDPTEEIVWIHGTHATERVALTTLRRVNLRPPSSGPTGRQPPASGGGRWVHDLEDRLRNPNEHGAKPAESQCGSTDRRPVR